MSTADSTAARAMYTQYSTVDEYFLKLREIVLARKVPRRMFVQPHTECNGNNPLHVVGAHPVSACLLAN